MVALARKLLIALCEIPAGPRRAAGLRHDSAAKPERRGPPSDLARAGDAAAGAHSAHEPHSRTAIRPGDHHYNPLPSQPWRSVLSRPGLQVIVRA
jgi:hypothetical protein